MAAPVLAATKLHIPTPRLSMVARPALLGELAAGIGARLTLLCAPAGSGKTSLLCQWHADSRTNRPFAWISLDGADNDPGRFWDGLIAAVRTAFPEFGEAAQASLHSPGTTVRDHVLPLIVNDLSARGDPVVLVLDDYHEIENAQIHEAVEVFIERLPDCAHLVIATRSDPPLALGRRRVRGELTEIRADGLRFGRDDAALLLNGVLGLDLDADQVDRLHQRTEGWAAALQLAGLSLKGRSDPQEFIESFAGDDQQVVDYLGYEVLDRQPSDARDFLLRTSILTRLTGPLCAAVAEIEDADALLRRLERDNLFLVALDSRREWYRYHHLFAEVLRHELARTAPELVAKLHRRAAKWYGEAGAVHEAIEHAVAAGDHGDAILLITTHWYEFLQGGRHETVSAWIDRLPLETVTNDPDLCLTKAWLGVNSGGLDEVDAWINQAAEAAHDLPDALNAAPLSSGVVSLRAIHRYMNGNVGAAVTAGRHALALERGGPASPWRPVGCPVLGLSLHWHGCHDDAADTLADAVRIAEANGNHLAAMHASGGLAAIEATRGDLAAAASHAAHAASVAAANDLGEHWARSLSLSVEADLRARNGQLETAGDLAGQAAGLARRGVASIEIAHALLVQAAVSAAQRRGQEAAERRREARAVIESCADPGILARRLRQVERPSGPSGEPGAEARGQMLSNAELAVLRLLRSELSQREISGELQLSFNTIKTHARNIYRKLGVATRAEAVDRARRLRLI